MKHRLQHSRNFRPARPRPSTTVATAFGALVVAFALVCVAKAGPQMTPGSWEVTTTMTSSFMPQPQVRTRTECITAEEAARDPLAAIVEDGSCRVLEQKDSGSSIEFKVECRGDGGVASKGTGVFTADGDTGSGHMDFVTSMPEMPKMPQMPGMPDMAGGTMTMKQTWRARRIGECP